MWIMFKKQFYKCLLQNAEYVMGFFQMIESYLNLWDWILTLFNYQYVNELCNNNAKISDSFYKTSSTAYHSNFIPDLFLS